MPSLWRTRRFLRSPASLRSPSRIMSSTPFTEVGCMGRTVPSVFLLTLCSYVHVIKEFLFSWIPTRISLHLLLRIFYLAFVVNQLKLPCVCHFDLRPDRHPNTGVHPHKVPLASDNGRCKKTRVTNSSEDPLIIISDVQSLTLLKCIIRNVDYV